MPIFDPYKPSAPPEPLPFGMEWPTLYMELICWSQQNLPDHLAMLESLAKVDTADHTRKCLGRIFRKRAEADMPWMWTALKHWKEAVLVLAPYITPGDKRICGMFPPAGGSRGAWAQWIATLDDLDAGEFVSARSLMAGTEAYRDRIDETYDAEERKAIQEEGLFK